jgi:hypothetical protein
MLSSPSIHIFNLDSTITNVLLENLVENRFSEYGQIKKPQNPPNGEVFVTFENPTSPQRTCSVNGYRNWKVQLSWGFRNKHKISLSIFLFLSNDHRYRGK